MWTSSVPVPDDASTGRRRSGKRWPGVPSDVPRVSRCETSALAIGALPPIVNAVTALTRGGAE
jgi:hypothetical protein